MKVQPELIDVLFRGLDALEGYLANILESADEGTEDNEEIINTLNSIADKAKGGTGEVPVPTPTAAPVMISRLQVMGIKRNTKTFVLVIMRKQHLKSKRRKSQYIRNYGILAG